jgi:hypothetical protein
MTIARRLGAACLLGCCFVAAAGVAAAASTASRAQIKDLICQKAIDPPARAFSITTVMRPIKGTAHMQLELQLQESTATPASFSDVPGAGLGTWLTPPNPNLGQRPGDIWVVHHPVANLAAPAVYRFSASFRWIGSSGQVLKTVTQLTRNCKQPELRPDLFVQSFTAAPLAPRPAIDRYTAVIGNQGGGPANNFELQFTDGAKVVTRTIAVLGKGATRTITIDGPLCAAGAPPTLVLDPTSAVDDSNRANNTATATCPAAPASTGVTAATGKTGAPARTGRKHRL